MRAFVEARGATPAQLEAYDGRLDALGLVEPAELRDDGVVDVRDGHRAGCVGVRDQGLPAVAADLPDLDLLIGDQEGRLLPNQVEVLHPPLLSCVK